jgi:type I restriction enzyme S subunit
MKGKQLAVAKAPKKRAVGSAQSRPVPNNRSQDAAHSDESNNGSNGRSGVETGEQLLARILEERRSSWQGRGQYRELSTPDISGLPSLPKNWTWATIEQITENFDGRRIPLKSDDRDKRSGRYPYYGASGIIDDIDDFLFDGDYLLIAEDGANLLSRSTPIAFKASGKFWVNNHAHVVRTTGDMPLSFLANYLNGTDLTFSITGSAQPKLTQAALNRLPVPLPPIEEQAHIVAEIEKQFTRLEAGVAALRRVQANLKRYRAAVLKAACEGRLVPTQTKEWRRGSLGDILVGIEAGKSFRCEERPPSPDEIGVVKVSAVTWGTYNELESKTCMDPERIETRYLVRPSDFLFSRANTIELIGACVIANKVDFRVMLSDKILRFHFTDAVDKRWVLYWLRSDFGRREIERLATGNQESMRNIGQERIRQIAMKFPPLTEQTRIVDEVERRLSVVEELEAVVAANLRRAARLRQAILQKAFTGELVRG